MEIPADIFFIKKANTNPMTVIITPQTQIMADSHTDGFNSLSMRLLGTSKNAYGKKKMVKHLDAR